MDFGIIFSIIISLILIIIIHNLFIYFKDNLTAPKVKDFIKNIVTKDSCKSSH